LTAAAPRRGICPAILSHKPKVAGQATTGTRNHSASKYSYSTVTDSMS
jgi:hypothetical protein